MATFAMTRKCCVSSLRGRIETRANHESIALVGTGLWDNTFSDSRIQDVKSKTYNTRRGTSVDSVHPTNPYQSSANFTDRWDAHAPSSVSFRNDGGLRRHALDHYLLHCHPKRLFFGSLAMILVSGFCLFASVSIGVVPYLLTGVTVMLGSRSIYLLLVRNTKRQILERLQTLELNVDGVMTLQMEGGELEIVRPNGTYRCPADQVKVYRTPRGLLVCPEPLSFVFVPRKSEFPAGSYRKFVKEIKSRIHSSSAS